MGSHAGASPLVQDDDDVPDPGARAVACDKGLLRALVMQFLNHKKLLARQVPLLASGHDVPDDSAQKHP